jgi:3-phenylpropionate/cinnamic acid dioxygenase small subunit
MNDDIQAINNLVFSYAELFDAGDFDGAVALFAHAMVTVAGSDFEARGPLVRSLLTDMVQLYEGVPSTKHIVANVIVEIEPDGLNASARSYYVALQARPNFPLQPILAGRWHDTLEKADGRWRFVTRVIHSDLMGDISNHLVVPQ